ncbi:MAG TPA: D-glycero-beta-D-manno-heptose-7-phosphate kinase [Smithellaceae bacterium]|nr:D-glycero-beta-D-manno-heptose-7-phosphate kinase [Smithellaceae bacterium]
MIVPLRKIDEERQGGEHCRQVMRGIARKKALEIIKNYPRSGVLVVGDVMVDHFIWGRVSRISPEAPVPVVDVQKDSVMLGGCANVLNTIYAMGGRVFVAGVIGEDDIGRGLVGQLQERRIDTKGILVEKARPTTLKTRIVAHGQQVVRFDHESRKPIADESAADILDYARSLRDQIGAIVISDYSKGVVSRNLVEGIKAMAAGSNIFLCVDPKSSDFGIYSGVDVLTPNHHEAQRAAGMEIVNGDDLLKLGETLLNKFDFQALLVTRGEEGMSLFERGRGIRHTHFPAQAKEVYDVTGAGDTVIGVLALSLAARANLKEATALANHAAGIVVGKVGTSTVSREELIGVL